MSCNLKYVIYVSQGISNGSEVGLPEPTLPPAASMESEREVIITLMSRQEDGGTLPPAIVLTPPGKFVLTIITSYIL